MTSIRDAESGVLEWSDEDHPDQYVVLVSPHLECTEKLLDDLMQQHRERTRDDFALPDEDWLRQELARSIGQAIDVNVWRDPAGVVEYSAEVAGRPIDWDWP